MLLKMNKKDAAEFSFFLAVPVIAGATIYELVKLRHVLGSLGTNAADAGSSWASFGPALGIGFAVSFVSAFVCIRWLIRYVATHDFTLFAWYRIVFGLVVLGTAWTGVVQWSH